MWDDAKQLNAIAAGARAHGALRCSLGRARVGRAPAGVRACARSSSRGRSTRASPAHLEAVIRDELAGTFFTMDLDARAHARSRACPGCARSRCAGSGRSGSRSTVEEHEPLARWNDAGLVNTQGEVFVADYDGELPQFEGPDGRAAEMAARYREWSDALAPLALAVQQVALSPRGGWQLRVAGGAAPLAIELGRDEPSRASRASSRPTGEPSARWRGRARASTTSTCAIATDSRRGCRASRGSSAQDDGMSGAMTMRATQAWESGQRERKVDGW